MTNEQIEEMKQKIGAELEQALMSRFIGEKVNESTVYNVKAYVKSFMRRYGDEEYKNLPEPKVIINGNEMTIYWEKK